MSDPLINRFKARLGDAQPQIGLWQALASPYTAEICAGAGFDWLLFDGEHGPNSIPTLLAQLQAVAAYDVDTVGRVPVGESWMIKQYLDIGFQTLLVPFVETAEQAAMLVRAMRYPPNGTRGVGPGLARAARWNGIPGYLDRTCAQTCLIVQIETVAGYENLDAIAAVDGVDAIFVGPADLSAAFGHRGQPDHPEMVARIEQAYGQIRDAGKPAGTLSLDPATARRAVELGCNFVAVGTDTSLLVRGADALARSSGASSRDTSEGSAQGGY